MVGGRHFLDISYYISFIKDPEWAILHTVSSEKFSLTALRLKTADSGTLIKASTNRQQSVFQHKPNLTLLQKKNLLELSISILVISSDGQKKKKFI
ncbi:hypothetical protein BpHYR1_041049 [Brachionus plicatilis]|uniref:Uncharacterized protein n=1 Tax=Brachionus plicatilis TaxID=10195 RepID=A0A3M7PIQ6_BRAPC|nr:hypothetical protein BpHYR1_041049 [Brachionus plicatilis]